MCGVRVTRLKRARFACSKRAGPDGDYTCMRAYVQRVQREGEGRSAVLCMRWKRRIDGREIDRGREDADFLAQTERCKGPPSTRVTPRKMGKRRKKGSICVVPSVISFIFRHPGSTTTYPGHLPFVRQVRPGRRSPCFPDPLEVLLDAAAQGRTSRNHCVVVRWLVGG